MKPPSQTVLAWQRRKARGGKGLLAQSLTQLITKVFVEQPLASPCSAKNDDPLTSEEANFSAV